MAPGPDTAVQVDPACNSLRGLHCEGIRKMPSLAADTMYNAFARPFWGVLLCLVTYLCEYGYLGWIDAALSGPAWLPLARVSYVAYLIHFLQIQRELARPRLQPCFGPD